MLSEIRTETYVEWQISRDGEVILWGTGTIHVDAPEFGKPAEGYELEVVGEGIPWDEVPQGVWTLITPEGYPSPYRSDYRGLAFGTLRRKIKPEVSPDITAVRLWPAEGFNHGLLAGHGAVEEADDGD